MWRWKVAYPMREVRGDWSKRSGSCKQDIAVSSLGELIFYRTLVARVEFKVL